MIKAAKIVGTGLARIALIGAGVGIGVVFGTLIIGAVSILFFSRFSYFGFMYNFSQISGFLNQYFIFFTVLFVIFIVSWFIFRKFIGDRNSGSLVIITSGASIFELVSAICLMLTLFLTIVILEISVYSLNEFMFEPNLVIYGEGHNWYFDYKYPNFIENHNKIIPDYSIMNDGSHTIPLNNYVPGMPEYYEYMKQYKGLSLRNIGITTHHDGVWDRRNIITWYFRANDPGAFYYHDPDATKITDFFLWRALTLHSRGPTDYNYYNWK